MALFYFSLLIFLEAMWPCSEEFTVYSLKLLNDSKTSMSMHVRSYKSDTNSEEMICYICYMYV